MDVCLHIKCATSDLFSILPSTNDKRQSTCSSIKTKTDMFLQMQVHLIASKMIFKQPPFILLYQLHIHEILENRNFFEVLKIFFLGGKSYHLLQSSVNIAVK